MLIPYEQLRRNTKMTKAELPAHMAKKREEDETPITGIFENKERPGEEIEFSYKWWPNQPNVRFVLQDGERATIPKGAMNWINTRGTPQYEHISTNSQVGAVQAGYLSTPAGQISKEPYRVKTMKYRYKFSPLTYYPGMFEENVNPELLVVEKDPAFPITKK